MEYYNRQDSIGLAAITKNGIFSLHKKQYQFLSSFLTTVTPWLIFSAATLPGGKFSHISSRVRKLSFR